MAHSCSVSGTVNPVPHRVVRLLAAAALGVSLSACGGADADSGSEARFDTAVGENACDLVKPKTVADAFDVPAEDLEQSNYVSSECEYEWEDADASLTATVAVEVFETADKAAENFEGVTKSMSADEVSDAMSKISDAAEASGDLDSKGEQEAADAASGALSGAIHFENVEGVGQKARFETNNGTLYVLEDNLRLRITAFKGPDMPLPDEISAEAMSKAANEWHQETMPERKAQATKLAKDIIAAL